MSPACARLSLGPIQNPVRGALDLLAAALSLAAALALWEASAHWPLGRLALGVFSSTQIGLCVASALYHSAPWGPIGKRRMQRVDHAMIFLQIAGTLTPLLLVGLAGDPARWPLLAAAWAIAAGGVAQKAFFPRIHEKACIPFQVLQACLVLPALPGLAGRFEGAALHLLALAGAIHLVGLVIFVTERPRLWPRWFSFHELFHLLLLGGGAVNYTLLVKLLAKAA